MCGIGQAGRDHARSRERRGEKIKELGAKSAFKGYRGYPCVLCTSVNEQVVHGIPSAERVLREGDIVSIDCGVVMDGYYGDSAITVPVGKGCARAPAAAGCNQASLERAIEVVRPGATLGDIGAAVQEVVEADGFSVVREFVGHGIGTRMHEDPQVPNYGQRGQGQAARRHGAGDRAHGECRQAGCSGIERWLDGGNRGWKLERALRAHRGGDRRRRSDFDAVGVQERAGRGAGGIGIRFVEGRRD